MGHVYFFLFGRASASAGNVGEMGKARFDIFATDILLQTHTRHSYQ